MATANKWLDGTTAALRPPPKLSLSEWADEHFYLSAESAAEPGRWHTLPYQRGILDAISDPSVERVSVMKSARIGYTKCMNAAIAYYMAQDPCPILVVQPTVEDAEGYSKEEIAPMLRDCPALAGLVSDAGKTSAQTILHKSFPGGVLSMVGANSGRGFRRVSRRVVIFDEVDGYPPSAGSEGDPIKLGERRAEYYHNRKIIAGSTPLVTGGSRIEELFAAGDRRRYFVPCPHCSHMDVLTFDRKSTTGHTMHWTESKPETAHFVCRQCGCNIEESHKYAMICAGEWRAEGEFSRHASFHIWTAYSLSPNASWGQIAAEFLESKSRPETLRTFVNTVLGDTWKERGDAPDYERLYDRRGRYPLGTCPVDPWRITAGVDVQKDRFVVEVVAWAADKQSWSVDAFELYGDTAADATWSQLDDLLNRGFPTPTGARTIDMLAIDSGYNTQMVYSWSRRYPLNRVIACKGSSTANALFSPPRKVEVNFAGKAARTGNRVWITSPDIGKGELYGWLGLRLGDDGTAPAGYCHFPEHHVEYFRQLTAEHLVTVTNRRTGRTLREWHVIPGRENHYLDARILARVAAAVLGIDRAVHAAASKPAAETISNPIQPPPAPLVTRQPSQPAGWLARRPRGWLK